MSNQSTIELLREMKFSAMASEFVAQLEDPAAYARKITELMIRSN